MENHERELAYITLNDWVGLPVADFVGMTVEEIATSLRYLLDESDRDNPTFDPADYDTIQKRAQAIYDLAEEKKAESAAYLGKLGGSKTSERKAASSRENGKLGGRPRKS